MKKIFVTYGDGAFKYARKRILNEAKKLNIFDEFYVYSKSDLPEYIKNSPLMAFGKGGGYWVWKPYVIWNTLQMVNEGDVIFYADAGCTLHKSSDWYYYFKELQSGYNGVLFQYNNKDYSWWYENKSPLLKYWTKKSAIDYLNTFTSNSDWLNEPQFVAGAFFIKKTKNNALINDWFRISLFHSELFSDEMIIEKPFQPIGFVNHRHDLTIFSFLAIAFKEQENYLVLPENLENFKKGSAIFASRKKDEHFISKQIKRFPFVKILLKRLFFAYQFFRSEK